MLIPELVISTEPTRGEVQYLEPLMTEGCEYHLIDRPGAGSRPKVAT